MAEETSRPANEPTDQPTWSARCLNCDAPLFGLFCSACGQRARAPGRPISEFLREFVTESLVLDGRIVRTLVTLLRNPGRLSAEYRRGKRASYSSPLRLYLATSLLCFSIMAIRGCLTDQPIAGDSPVLTRPDVKDGEIVADELDPEFENDDRMLPRLGRHVRDRSREFARLPPGEQRRRLYAGLSTYIPRVLFLAVPVFAALVQLVLRRAVRASYVDCLVFGFHVHALWFLAQTVRTIAAPIVDNVVEIATVVHTVIAVRAAWELTWSATWWRALLLALSYSLVLLGSLSVAAMLSIVVS